MALRFGELSVSPPIIITNWNVVPKQVRGRVLRGGLALFLIGTNRIDQVGEHLSQQKTRRAGRLDY